MWITLTLTTRMNALLMATGDVKMFEGMQELKELNLKGCTNITGNQQFDNG